jgi:hypothetical protein
MTPIFPHNKVFYLLSLNPRKKCIIIFRKLRIVEVENVIDKKEYNQFDEVTFFIDKKDKSHQNKNQLPIHACFPTFTPVAMLN